MRFYLGTHMANWLGTLDVPLFVSDRRLRDRKTFPRAHTGWVLDSGGFTELSTHGSWEYGPTPAEYVARTRRYAEEIGSMDWAAPQDWMCEPWVIAKTGLSVTKHQALTVDNYLQLRDLDGALPFMPVLQGWHVEDYRRHVDLYAAAGIDLRDVPVVGLGTVCRRQHTGQIERIVFALHGMGIRLHGFGVKTDGLGVYGYMLTSADSMAWSYGARREAATPGCLHQSCANCPIYALAWRTKVLRGSRYQQLALQEVPA